MLFLMNGDVPCTQATWVRLDNAAAPPDAPSRAAPGGLVAAASTTFEDGAAGAVFTGSVFAGAAATFDFAAGGPAAYSGYQGAAISVTNGGTATFHIQVRHCIYSHTERNVRALKLLDSPAGTIAQIENLNWCSAEP